MNFERHVRSMLYPVTGPQQRRLLIRGRNRAVGLAAMVRSRVGDRPLPDFIVGGVQKGGTTFLFQEMIRHPDVHSSLTKEVHFFDDHYDRGVDWYRGMFPTRRRDAMICGEASPAYVYHPNAIRRIAETLPEVQLIIVLRDPVKRALSHYAHERRLGFEPAESFDSALALEDERVGDDYEQVRDGRLPKSFAVGHFTYMRRGHYVDQLERAVELMGRDRVHIIISEHMFADPRSTVRSALDIVGAGAWDVPQPNGNDMSFPSEPMTAATERMLRNHFEPYNERLEQFLGYGLPWG